MLNAEPVEGAAVDPERVALMQERLLQLKGVMSIEKFFSGCVQSPPGYAAGAAFVFAFVFEESYKRAEAESSKAPRQAVHCVSWDGLSNLSKSGHAGGSWERPSRA